MTLSRITNVYIFRAKFQTRKISAFPRARIIVSVWLFRRHKCFESNMNKFAVRKSEEERCRIWKCQQSFEIVEDCWSLDYDASTAKRNSFHRLAEANILHLLQFKCLLRCAESVEVQTNGAHSFFSLSPRAQFFNINFWILNRKRTRKKKCFMEAWQNYRSEKCNILQFTIFLSALKI